MIIKNHNNFILSTNPIPQTAKTGRKTNKTFMILSALGIIFVVDDHLAHPLSILTSIFPYDSFYMPMFAFISGYFFKETYCRSWKDTIIYGIKKFQKLFLPYLGWILFYDCLNWLFCHWGIWHIGPLPLREIIYGIVTSGVVFAFNSPAWFAPLLFCVSVCYCMLRFLLRKCWNDTFALVALISLGAASVYIARTDYNVPLLYTPLKIAFFLQFYHMGLFFKNHLETWFHKTSTITVCFTAVTCNIILISIYGHAIEFGLCSAMAGFGTTNLLLPLITSVTGIAFWLKIANLLVPIWGESKLVNYISDHTFFIMTHHIGVKHLFIALCALGFKLGVPTCSGIDMQQFLTDGLYLYTTHTWCSIAAFVFTMVFLIIACEAIQTIKHFLHSYLKKQP